VSEEQKIQSIETSLNEEQLRKLILKPLADPVVAAIFANENVAGIAAQSLVNAVLEIDGDPPMGKVIHLTTQKTIENIFSRGYRLDIEGASDNELTDVEIQLTPLNMVDRSFLQAGQLAAANAKIGDKMSDVLRKMPRILMINLNWFENRPKHPDFTQPIDLIYRKPDPETKEYSMASDKVHIYNVEITKFIKNVLPEFKRKPYSPKVPRLYYWLWALTESQSKGIQLMEVIQMSEALQEFVKDDKGFEQFTERYEEVNDDMAVRRQFAAWTTEMDKLDVVRAIGISEGKAAGIREKALDAARSLLSLGVAPEIVAKGVKLTLEEVIGLAK
jgi:predicted transposase/invertase (TIGR01784 family)